MKTSQIHNFVKKDIFLPILLNVAVPILTMLLAVPVVSFAQPERKIIFRFNSAKPVEIVSADIHDRRLVSGDEYKGNMPWLKGMAIEINNRSGKSIKYIDFAVNLYDEKGKEIDSLVQFHIRFGIRKNALQGIASGLELEPGVNNRSVKLFVNELQSDQLHALMSTYGDKQERVQIFPNMIIYDDGSVWWLGKWYRANPDNPDDFIPVTETKGEGWKDLNLFFIGQNADQGGRAVFFV